MKQPGFDCPVCGHHFQINSIQAGLSRLERRVLNEVVVRAITGQPTPTYTEIAAALERSNRSGVSQIVARLVEKGFLTKAYPPRHRSVQPTSAAVALFQPKESSNVA